MDRAAEGPHLRPRLPALLPSAELPDSSIIFGASTTAISLATRITIRIIPSSRHAEDLEPFLRRLHVLRALPLLLIRSFAPRPVASTAVMEERERPSPRARGKHFAASLLSQLPENWTQAF
jgi:hypothetical protein